VLPFSVIVPAHDEEHVIATCLLGLLAGAEEGEVEVVVVCNGCRDRTAEIARSISADVIVLELAEASKTSALNVGDRAATRFPRFYVDADLQVGVEALRATARVLDGSEVLCASPAARYELAGRPWIVRSYFEVWQRLPYFNDERVGGVYALSEAGRARFAAFPDVIADDQFVLQQFDPSERRCLLDHHFVVQAPRSVWALVATRARVYRGNRELAGLATPTGAVGGSGAALARLALHPSQAPAAAAYAAVCVLGRIGARRHRGRWERDESTRVPIETGGSGRLGAQDRLPARGGGRTSPVGYLVSRYPAPSHTFVLREVRELRRAGLEVRTFSIRRPQASDMLSEIDREEAATTDDLLPATAAALLAAHVRLWRRSPRAWGAVAAEALRASPPGARALLWQVFYLAEAVLLHERCRRYGIRHLHAHLANVAADVAWLATRIGQHSEPSGDWRWSFTMHGPTELSEVGRFNLRRKVEAAGTVVCISDYCRSQLMRLVSRDHWEKLRVVRCGIDTTEFSFVDRRERATPSLTVLTVGRLAPDKGHAVLLEAAGAIRDAGLADLRFVLVGDGPERDLLRSTIDQLGLGRIVKLLGAVGQDCLFELYRRADLFCLPSFAEGLPIVLMEAMATGLPVVSTSVAGIPELVRHGQSGLLVPPGRAAELAAALVELAERPERRHELGVAGRAAVEDAYQLSLNVAELDRVLFRSRAGYFASSGARR